MAPSCWCSTSRPFRLLTHFLTDILPNSVATQDEVGSCFYISLRWRCLIMSLGVLNKTVGDLIDKRLILSALLLVHSLLVRPKKVIRIELFLPDPVTCPVSVLFLLLLSSIKFFIHTFHVVAVLPWFTKIN